MKQGRRGINDTTTNWVRGMFTNNSMNVWNSYTMTLTDDTVNFVDRDPRM